MIGTVEQSISAGGNWNDSVPTTDPVETNGVLAYPADTVGGRFDISMFDFTEVVLWQIERITINFNGVAVKDVWIRRPGGQDFYIFQSINAAENKLTITDIFKLAPDEYISVVSTGAATAMSARVVARPLVYKV